MARDMSIFMPLVEILAGSSSSIALRQSVSFGSILILHLLYQVPERILIRYLHPEEAVLTRESPSEKQQTSKAEKQNCSTLDRIGNYASRNQQPADKTENDRICCPGPVC
jgi:hypothetical protein